MYTLSELSERTDTWNGKEWEKKDLSAINIKSLILQNSSSKFRNTYNNQLNLFDKQDALIQY